MEIFNLIPRSSKVTMKAFHKLQSFVRGNAIRRQVVRGIGARKDIRKRMFARTGILFAEKYPILIKCRADWMGQVTNIVLYDVHHQITKHMKLKIPFTPIMELGAPRKLRLHLAWARLAGGNAGTRSPSVRSPSKKHNIDEEDEDANSLATNPDDDGDDYHDKIILTLKFLDDLNKAYLQRKVLLVMTENPSERLLIQNSLPSNEFTRVSSNKNLLEIVKYRLENGNDSEEPSGPIVPRTPVAVIKEGNFEEEEDMEERDEFVAAARMGSDDAMDISGERARGVGVEAEEEDNFFEVLPSAPSLDDGDYLKDNPTLMSKSILKDIYINNYYESHVETNILATEITKFGMIWHSQPFLVRILNERDVTQLTIFSIKNNINFIFLMHRENINRSINLRRKVEKLLSFISQHDRLYRYLPSSTLSSKLRNLEEAVLSVDDIQQRERFNFFQGKNCFIKPLPEGNGVTIILADNTSNNVSGANQLDDPVIGDLYERCIQGGTRLHVAEKEKFNRLAISKSLFRDSFAMYTFNQGDFASTKGQGHGEEKSLLSSSSAPASPVPVVDPILAAIKAANELVSGENWEQNYFGSHDDEGVPVNYSPFRSVIFQTEREAAAIMEDKHKQETELRLTEETLAACSGDTYDAEEGGNKKDHDGVNLDDHGDEDNRSIFSEEEKIESQPTMEEGVEEKLFDSSSNNTIEPTAEEDDQEKEEVVGSSVSIDREPDNVVMVPVVGSGADIKEETDNESVPDETVKEKDEVPEEPLKSKQKESEKEDASRELHDVPLQVEMLKDVPLKLSSLDLLALNTGSRKVESGKSTFSPSSSPLHHHVSVPKLDFESPVIQKRNSAVHFTKLDSEADEEERRKKEELQKEIEEEEERERLALSTGFTSPSLKSHKTKSSRSLKSTSSSTKSHSPSPNKKQSSKTSLTSPSKQPSQQTEEEKEEDIQTRDQIIDELVVDEASSVVNASLKEITKERMKVLKEEMIALALDTFFIDLFDDFLFDFIEREMKRKEKKAKETEKKEVLAMLQADEESFLSEAIEKQRIIEEKIRKAEEKEVISFFVESHFIPLLFDRVQMKLEDQNILTLSLSPTIAATSVVVEPTAKTLSYYIPIPDYEEEDEEEEPAVEKKEDLLLFAGRGEKGYDDDEGSLDETGRKEGMVPRVIRSINGIYKIKSGQLASSSSSSSFAPSSHSKTYARNALTPLLHTSTIRRQPAASSVAVVTGADLISPFSIHDLPRQLVKTPFAFDSAEELKKSLESNMSNDGLSSLGGGGDAGSLSSFSALGSRSSMIEQYMTNLHKQPSSSSLQGKRSGTTGGGKKGGSRGKKIQFSSTFNALYPSHPSYHPSSNPSDKDDNTSLEGGSSTVSIAKSLSSTSWINGRFEIEKNIVEAVSVVPTSTSPKTAPASIHGGKRIGTAEVNPLDALLNPSRGKKGKKGKTAASPSAEEDGLYIQSVKQVQRLGYVPTMDHTASSAGSSLSGKPSKRPWAYAAHWNRLLSEFLASHAVENMKVSNNPQIGVSLSLPSSSSALIPRSSSSSVMVCRPPFWELKKKIKELQKAISITSSSVFANKNTSIGSNPRLKSGMLSVEEMVCALAETRGSVGEVVARLSDHNLEFISEIQLVCSALNVKSMVCSLPGGEDLFNNELELLARQASPLKSLSPMRFQQMNSAEGSREHGRNRSSGGNENSSMGSAKEGLSSSFSPFMKRRGSSERISVILKKEKAAALLRQETGKHYEEGGNDDNISVLTDDQRRYHHHSSSHFSLPNGNEHQEGDEGSVTSGKKSPVGSIVSVTPSLEQSMKPNLLSRPASLPSLRDQAGEHSHLVFPSLHVSQKCLAVVRFASYIRMKGIGEEGVGEAGGVELEEGEGSVTGDDGGSVSSFEGKHHPLSSKSKSKRKGGMSKTSSTASMTSSIGSAPNSSRMNTSRALSKHISSVQLLTSDGEVEAHESSSIRQERVHFNFDNIDSDRSERKEVSPKKGKKVQYQEERSTPSEHRSKEMMIRFNSEMDDNTSLPSGGATAASPTGILASHSHSSDGLGSPSSLAGSLVGSCLTTTHHSLATSAMKKSFRVQESMVNDLYVEHQKVAPILAVMSRRDAIKAKQEETLLKSDKVYIREVIQKKIQQSNPHYHEIGHSAQEAGSVAGGGGVSPLHKHSSSNSLLSLKK
jgi:hypothetical protein